LTETDYQHLKPMQGTEKLTTDHCFVRSGQATMLKLLNNVDQKIKTDHKYTLSLTLGRRDTGPLPDQEM
jgi:hypothetical protein